MAAQILGFGAFDSTNSAQIIEPIPEIYAVMGGAGVKDVGASLFQDSDKANSRGEEKRCHLKAYILDLKLVLLSCILSNFSFAQRAVFSWYDKTTRTILSVNIKF